MSECLCGCGGTTNGRFRPGHDAKLKSRLLKAARAGDQTAVDEIAELGWSKFLSGIAARTPTQGTKVNSALKFGPKPPVPGKTGTSFGFSIVERVIQESLGRRAFGASQIAKVVDFFGQTTLTCVYCGSAEFKRWDHLVPVMRGGETVLGNMVPACAPCDDSKQAFPYESWLPTRLRKLGITDPALLESRLAKLRAYALHFGYTTRRLEDRLSADELSRLAALRERARELRQDMEKLFLDHSYRLDSELHLDGSSER